MPSAERKSFVEYVREFHETFGVAVAAKPTIPPAVIKNLRISLILEEYGELLKAMMDEDILSIADAIADLHYVLSGTSLAYGIPEDAVFAEVHRSNMSKADPDGTVYKRSDGKILKSLHFTPPNIKKDIMFRMSGCPASTL